MKYVKSLIVLSVIAGSGYSVSAESLSVTQIEVQNENTLEVTLSENPNLGEGKIDAGVNILNDLSIQEIIIEENSENEVTLVTEQKILPQMKYSIVTISGMKGSIDFGTPADIKDYISVNSNANFDQDIESIKVIDEHTLTITYNEKLESQFVSDYDFKLLLESNVTNIEKKDLMKGTLTINVEPNLQENQQYILMFLDVQDVSGSYLEFDTGIYDFETQEITTSQEKDILSTDPESVTSKIEETVNTQEASINTNKPESVVTSEIVITPLNAAPSLQKKSGGVTIIEDVKRIENIEPVMNQEIEKMQQEEEATKQSVQEGEEIHVENMNQSEASDPRITKSIQEVAQSADTTPATGAASWVIILASIVINTLYYYTRRKTYKYI